MKEKDRLSVSEKLAIFFASTTVLTCLFALAAQPDTRTTEEKIHALETRVAEPCRVSNLNMDLLCRMDAQADREQIEYLRKSLPSR